MIVNISCSRGLVWFNISQDNAGGWRNEEITNAIKVSNNQAILIPLWDDCYGDHCGTLMKLNISCSPRLKVVTNQEELINRLEEPSQIMTIMTIMTITNQDHHDHHQPGGADQQAGGAVQGCGGGDALSLCFPRLWCGPLIITIIITTILFLHIVLFSLRLCYSLRRRCRSSPLLRRLCRSETAG